MNNLNLVDLWAMCGVHYVKITSACVMSLSKILTNQFFSHIFGLIIHERGGGSDLIASWLSTE